MKIFLARHATPDWTRRDIPYDVPPGPPLIEKGEQEAQALAAFLKFEGVVRLYHSPFERAARTAQIVASLNGIPCMEESRLTEWRGRQEGESEIRARMKAMFDEVLPESRTAGSIGLVSHGGPIGALLLELGLDPHELAAHRKFDTTNPLPPAGAWEVTPNGKSNSWNLRLKFIPILS